MERLGFLQAFKQRRASLADSALDGTDTTGLEKIAADFIGEGGAGNETYNSILDALGGN